MKRYRVRIEGRNFLFESFDGGKEIKIYGFYVTRDVEADSFEDA